MKVILIAAFLIGAAALATVFVARKIETALRDGRPRAKDDTTEI